MAKQEQAGANTKKKNYMKYKPKKRREHREDGATLRKTEA